MIRRLMLVALLASIASVTYLPILGKVLGPTAAYALDDDPGVQDDEDISGDQQ